jgi:hypothetical protein
MIGRDLMARRGDLVVHDEVHDRKRYYLAGKTVGISVPEI